MLCAVLLALALLGYSQQLAHPIGHLCWRSVRHCKYMTVSLLSISGNRSSNSSSVPAEFVTDGKLLSIWAELDKALVFQNTRLLCKLVSS